MIWSSGPSTWGGLRNALRSLITTKGVPVGTPGVTYEPTALVAEGARGAVHWHVATGELPPGMQLTRTGVIVGTPLAAGYFPFTAYAQDESGSDRQDLAIAVCLLPDSHCA